MALKQTLIPSTWYKFKPYSSKPDIIWYMVHKSQDGTHYMGGDYIGKIESNSNYFYRPDINSRFGEYAGSTYEPVVGKELAWCEACKLAQKIVDREEFYTALAKIGYEEIINNYSIY